MFCVLGLWGQGVKVQQNTLLHSKAPFPGKYCICETFLPPWALSVSRCWLGHQSVTRNELQNANPIFYLKRLRGRGKKKKKEKKYYLPKKVPYSKKQTNKQNNPCVAQLPTGTSRELTCTGCPQTRHFLVYGRFCCGQQPSPAGS